MFEGTAIYNLLREYEGHVTVKVLGIAASAASIIAMAGDDIQIGRGAFLMIHNCWVYAMETAMTSLNWRSHWSHSIPQWLIFTRRDPALILPPFRN